MRFYFHHFVLALITIALYGCGSTVDDQLRENAGRFLSAVGTRDYALAHRYLTTSLAGRTSAEELKTFLALTGLEDPGKHNWDSSETEGDGASLSGTVTISGGQESVPIRINFKKEGVHWKIAGLERGIEVATPSGTMTMYAPTAKTSAELARQTTTAFATAVNGGDLSRFWDSMSDVFKQNYSAEQFTTSFEPFVQESVNLLPAARRTPQFSNPPTIRANGELVLQGSFATEPSRVAFEYRYVRDGERWRESGLTIRLVPKT